MSGGERFGPGRGRRFGGDRGMGCGMGYGWGPGPNWGMNRAWRNRIADWCRGMWQSFPGFSFASRREEIDSLKQDAAGMEEALGQIKRRIKELESEKQKQES